MIRHTVQRGERLSSIAARYGVRPTLVLAANPHKPRSTTARGAVVFASLAAGEELFVPLGAPAPTAGEAYCTAHGGTVEQRTTDANSGAYFNTAGVPAKLVVHEGPPNEPYSVCIFPDKSECPVDQYMAGQCASGTGPTFCTTHGGTLIAAAGSDGPTCAFDDGSGCNAEEYRLGACTQGEHPQGGIDACDASGGVWDAKAGVCVAQATTEKTGPSKTPLLIGAGIAFVALGLFYATLHQTPRRAAGAAT